MDKKNKTNKIKTEYNKVCKTSDKYSLRFWVAEKSLEIGYGGIEVLHDITGLSRKTIYNWRKKLSLQKSNPTAVCHFRKPGSGRPPKIEYAEIEKVINDILKIEEAREQNLSVCYSSLGSRELISKLKEKGISISHTSMIALLRKQGFFVYGTNKNNKGYPRIARNIHIKQIHRNTTHFHQSNNPVIFVDIQKYSPAVSSGKTESKSNKPGESQVDILNVILEWWKDVGSREYPASSKILIFINGGPLKIEKQLFKKIADSTSLKTTFCHIPAGIIKWFDLESKVFNRNISIRQSGKRHYCNVSIYIIPKPENPPSNILETIHSFMHNKSKSRRVYDLSPPEWYYTLTPAVKKPPKECESDKDLEITKKLPTEDLHPENHNHISNKKLTDVIESILKEDSGFDKIQAFSYSAMSINQMHKQLCKRYGFVSRSTIVNTIQNDISHVVFKAYKIAQPHSFETRKQQFEFIKNYSISFQDRNIPVVFVDISGHNSDSNSIEYNEETADFLLSSLKEWWNKHKEDICNSKKMLIMTHRASLPIAKECYQKFSNYCNMLLTMCHIPAGIINVRFVRKHSMAHKDKLSQYVTKILVLDCIKQNEDKPTPEITKERYTPPESWYYTLKPVNKENNA